MAIEEQQDSAAQQVPAQQAGVLRWQPWVRRMRRWGRLSQGAQTGIALRLTTPAFLNGLMRRHAVPTGVAHRAENAWPSCAMDWRVLLPRLAARSADKAAAGDLGARQPVKWHTVERVVVREAGVAAVAPVTIAPDASPISMAFSGRAEQVRLLAAHASMEMMRPMVSHAELRHDAAMRIPYPESARADVVAATPNDVVVPVLPMRHPDFSTVIQRSAGHQEGSGLAPAPMVQAPARHAGPAQAQHVATTDYSHITLPALAPEGAAISASKINALAPHARFSSEPASAVHPGPAMPFAPAARVDQGGPSGAPVDMAMPMLVSRSRPTPTSVDPAPAEQSLGDMLYDRAMMGLRRTVPQSSFASTPTVSSLPSGPPPVAQPPAQASRWSPVQPTPRIGRDDIEQVAARVMRIIRREQRREREAKGAF
jgi:hypothetical protein